MVLEGSLGNGVGVERKEEKEYLIPMFSVAGLHWHWHFRSSKVITALHPLHIPHKQEDLMLKLFRPYVVSKHAANSCSTAIQMPISTDSD